MIHNKRCTHTRCPFSSRTRKSPFSNPLEMVAMFITGKARRSCAPLGTRSGCDPGGWGLAPWSTRAWAWDSMVNAGMVQAMQGLVAEGNGTIYGIGGAPPVRCN